MRPSQQAVYRLILYWPKGGVALQATAGKWAANLAPADTPIETGICSDPCARPTDVELYFTLYNGCPQDFF